MWYFANSYPVNDFMPWFVYIYWVNHITEENILFNQLIFIYVLGAQLSLSVLTNNCATVFVNIKFPTPSQKNSKL